MRGWTITIEQMAEASESQADIGRIEDIDGFDDLLSLGLVYRR